MSEINPNLEIDPNAELNPGNEEVSSESKIKIYKKPLLIFWSIFIVGIVCVVLFFAGVSNGTFGFMPTFEELENPKSSLATEVYTADGELLGKFYFQNRSFIDHDELSTYLIDALIATEDVRFESHSGIDLRGLGRVLKV